MKYFIGILLALIFVPTLAVSYEALSAVTGGSADVEGLLALLGGLSTASSTGNYWWMISTIVYMLLELSKGRVPGTKIQIPSLPVLLSEHLSPNALKGISLGLSAALALVFVIGGRPVDAAVADFVQGWLGAMGLHNAMGLKTLFSKGVEEKPRSKAKKKAKKKVKRSSGR